MYNIAMKFQKFNYSYFSELIDKPYEEYRREQLEKDKIKIGTIIKTKDGQILTVDADLKKNIKYQNIIEYHEP